MKNKLLVAASAVVGLATVAYAAFATTLSINGTGSATGTWSVAITGIALDATSVGATNETAPVVAGDSLSATFDANLAYPGASAVYNVTIKNNGNIDAKLSTLSDLTTLNATAPSYLTYAVTGVAANDILAAGNTVTAKVTVTWAAADNHSGAASKPATINFGYVQNT